VNETILFVVWHAPVQPDLGATGRRVSRAPPMRAPKKGDRERAIAALPDQTA
jgi:hypothetical protein